MSQNLPKRSLRDFLFYVILIISYLRARTTSKVTITDRFLAAPVQANRDFFPGILTVQFLKQGPAYKKEGADPNKRVSMGLNDRRKTAKNLVDSRKN